MYYLKRYTVSVYVKISTSSEKQIFSLFRDVPDIHRFSSVFKTHFLLESLQISESFLDALEEIQCRSDQSGIKYNCALLRIMYLFIVKPSHELSKSWKMSDLFDVPSGWITECAPLFDRT